MRRSKRRFFYFLASLLLFIPLVYLALNYSPSSQIQFSVVRLPVVVPFFLFLFASIWFLARYFLNSGLQATIISILTSAYLAIRSLGLKHLFFFILFIILFIALELLVKKRK